MFLKTIFITLGAVASVAGAPASSASGLTPRQEEMPFSYFWSDGVGRVDFIEENPTRSIFEWRDSGAFLGGRGREKGNGNTIYIEAYLHFFEPGNAYLQLYGETTNPKTEYRVIESHGNFTPFPDEPGFPKLIGNATIDESVYQIYHQVRVSPALGEEPIHQYYSVREKQRALGLISPQLHFDAYERLGHKLGDLGMQIVGVEGYYSSGQSIIDMYLD